MRADLFLVAAAGALVIGLLYLAKKGVSSGAIDPTSANNLAYRASNSLVQLFTGDPNQTSGGLAHDTLNPRAGLADNEYSPAPGIIMTLGKNDPRYVAPAANDANTMDFFSAMAMGGLGA